MAGGIGLYGMTSDGEAGADHAAAAKKEQAGILFADAVKMVKASKALMKRLEFSGGEGREYNIAHHKSGSFFRPVSRDTGRTGSVLARTSCLPTKSTSCPTGAPSRCSSAASFRRQPLLFMITNSAATETVLPGRSTSTR